MKQLDAKQRWVGKFILGKHEALGDLAYDPVKGIELDARIWPAPKDDPPFTIYPCIPGQVGGDRPCTLFDAGDLSVRKTSGEKLHNIAVNTIVLGLDCKSADEPLFNALSFNHRPSPHSFSRAVFGRNGTTGAVRSRHPTAR